MSRKGIFIHLLKVLHLFIELSILFRNHLFLFWVHVRIVGELVRKGSSFSAWWEHHFAEMQENVIVVQELTHNCPFLMRLKFVFGSQLSWRGFMEVVPADTRRGLILLGPSLCGSLGAKERTAASRTLLCLLLSGSLSFSLCRSGEPLGSSPRCMAHRLLFHFRSILLELLNTFPENVQ